MTALPSHVPDTIKYTTFLRNVAGIGDNYLPDNTPLIQHSFDHASSLVNLDIGVLAAQPQSWSFYELAIYNLATHMLIEYATDISYSIATLAWAAGLVTGETVEPHQMEPGDVVRLLRVSPLAYAGPAPNTGVTITDITDTTHFGYHIARDPGVATLLIGASVQEQFFANARRQLKLNSFVPGVVASTSDLSTSVGLDNPDFFKNLTLDQLQLLKTSYGRAYLAIAQKYGPNVWGVS